jgi:ATP-dependent protease ClpP protease subunit
MNGPFSDTKSAEGFIQEISALKAKNIVLRFNTPGGDVFEGHAISNFINQSDKKFIGINDGYCASIGTEIFLNCDVRKTAKNAKFMIHRVTGTVRGNAEEIKARADQMIEIENDLADLYESKMNLDRETITNMVNKETTFNAEKAKTWKFVDEVINCEAKLCNYDENFKLINQNNLPGGKEMDLKILELLNISDETKAYEAIQRVVTTNTALTAQNETLKNSSQNLKIDLLIAQKKISVSQKEFATSLLNKDEDLFNTWLESNNPQTPPTQNLDLPNNPTGDSDPTADELMNNLELFEKYQKEQPQKLKSILNNAGITI